MLQGKEFDLYLSNLRPYVNVKHISFRTIRQVTVHENLQILSVLARRYCNCFTEAKFLYRLSAQVIM